MKTIRVLLLPILLVLLAGAWWLLKGHAQPLPVRQVLADQGSIESGIRATGVALPQRMVKLSAAQSGTVADAGPRVGDTVRTGDVLVRLDDEEIRAELLSRERAADEVATVVALQRRRVQDLREDLRQGAAMRSALREAESVLRREQARHARLLADLDAARVRLKKTRVLAPLDATVTERHVETGEQLQPGKALYTLATTDVLDVLVKLDPAEAADVRVGTPVRVSLEGRAGVALDEKVVRIEPSVKREGNADHLPVWVSVSAPPAVSGIRPQQQVDVDFMTDAHPAAVRLPLDALVTMDGRDHVWQIRAGKAHPVPVTLGRIGDRHVEIRDGVAAGQAVVLPEGRTLKEGDPVQAVGEERP